MSTQPTLGGPEIDWDQAGTFFGVSSNSLYLFGSTVNRDDCKPSKGTWLNLFRHVNVALMHSRNPRIVLMSKRRAFELFCERFLAIGNFTEASEGKIAIGQTLYSYVRVPMVLKGRYITCVIIDTEENFFILSDENNNRSRGAVR